MILQDFTLLLLYLLALVLTSLGRPLLHIQSFPLQSDWQLSFEELLLEKASASSPHSAPSPRNSGHHHRVKPIIIAPAPSEDTSCDQVCTEPLTAVPFSSSCGCVFPMTVRLLLDVAPYAIFPLMNQLEIEVAAGTYLEQSQVKIMGASADSQNQAKTIVDINLVPLGEKFDNTTAILVYNRFWHKKMPLNENLFGHYEVVAISYPGIPSSPTYPDYMGSGPSESSGNLPINANFVGKSQKMNFRTISIVALSAFVVVLVFVGAVFIFIRWRKYERPSSAVGPAFASSMNKRSVPLKKINVIVSQGSFLLALF